MPAGINYVYTCFAQSASIQDLTTVYQMTLTKRLFRPGPTNNAIRLLIFCPKIIHNALRGFAEAEQRTVSSTYTVLSGMLAAVHILGMMSSHIHAPFTMRCS